jgi:hypothetical protein
MNYEDFNDMDNDYNCMLNMDCLEENSDSNFLSKDKKIFSAIKEIPEEENQMDIDDINNKEKNNDELNYKLLKNKKKHKKNSEDNINNNSQNSINEIKDENKNKKKKRNKENSSKEEINEKNLLEFPDIDKLDELSLKEECRKYGIKTNNIKNMKTSLEEIYNFLKNKTLPQYIKNNLDNFLIEDYNQNSISSKNLTQNVTEKNVLSEEKKILIIDTIKNNKKIWGKMLLFQSLDLKDIKKILNDNKITVSNNDLKKLLIDLGVVLDGGWKNK